MASVQHMPHHVAAWPMHYSPQDVYGPKQTYFYHQGYAEPRYHPFASQLPQFPQRQVQHHHQPSYPISPSWTDARFSFPHAYAQYPRPTAHHAQIQSHATVAAPVPDAPRGPPRKPKQSGHAVWMGNLPVNASIHELKDYCSRGASEDIESVFLISKSNCAFANYKTHMACEAAMSHFRNVSFKGRRLVCRLRMQHVAPPPKNPSVVSDTSTISTDSLTSPSTPLSNQSGDPVIVGSNTPPTPAVNPEIKTSIDIHPPMAFDRAPAVPERFFIIKSLTVQDLIASVNNGTWEAQAHNEDNLQHAFNHAHSVYLVFSANKSGEYFGLARMTSGIFLKRRESVVSAPLSESDSAQSSDPRSVATPSNESAPSGKIYDDSTRGTIFWEADQAAASDGASFDDEASLQQQKQFNIEWISTSRVPFYRTRGLRNPWNGMKEVKIARDGTELEPNVGRHLIHLFRPN